MSDSSTPTSPGPFPRSASQNSSGSNTEATILVPLDKTQEQDIITVCRNWQNTLYSTFALRSEMEYIDRMYMREQDWTDDTVASKIANRTGDTRKIQNVTVPIVMPQVSAAVTYLANVFLTGYPIFPVVSDPANENVALQLETIMQENAMTAGWAQQLSMFFRDGLKYNLHAIEFEWQQKANWTIDNDLTSRNGTKARKILWEGNVIKRMDLYNTFWDPRVHPSEVHTKGEFAGYTEMYSRIRFKDFCNDLYQRADPAKVVEALESQSIQGGIGASVNSPYGYYIPTVNPYPFYNKQASMDWMNWAQNVRMNNTGIAYKNAYSVTKMYAKILPADFGLKVPEKNTPQIWKFVIVNGQVVLTAERLTNVHKFLPILFGQPIEDGLDYQTKSFAQNVGDMQHVASALWSGALASKRRLVGDRVLYDPSRIREQDINSPNPTAKIPVRPSAYGKPISDAVYQFPYRDEETNSLVQSASAVINMANNINGQNPAQQGQFVKGNKTRHEYDDVMGHGNGQNQQLAISTENQVFVPLKEGLKLNILQFQGAKTIFNTGRGKSVNINPIDLRKSAVHFKVCDGLIPSDKVTGDDLLQVALQQIGTSPQLASGFNLAPAFIYLMQTQGLDLTPFAKSPAQLQYEQALEAWKEAAAAALKSGGTFSTPMPQPSPQLQQEQQQNTPGTLPASAALESTQA